MVTHSPSRGRVPVRPTPVVLCGNDDGGHVGSEGEEVGRAPLTVCASNARCNLGHFVPSVHTANATHTHTRVDVSVQW